VINGIIIFLKVVPNNKQLEYSMSKPLECMQLAKNLLDFKQETNPQKWDICSFVSVWMLQFVSHCQNHLLT